MELILNESSRYYLVMSLLQLWSSGYRCTTVRSVPWWTARLKSTGAKVFQPFIGRTAPRLWWMFHSNVSTLSCTRPCKMQPILTEPTTRWHTSSLEVFPGPSPPPLRHPWTYAKRFWILRWRFPFNLVVLFHNQSCFKNISIIYIRWPLPPCLKLSS